jgi:hypothetical protein
MNELTFWSIQLTITENSEPLELVSSNFTPLPRSLGRSFMLYMQFAPLGKGQWAVTGTSKIAEVTVGRAHCAITPTKGHTVTPEERAGVGVFMQEACPVGRKCRRCPEQC